MTKGPCVDGCGKVFLYVGLHISVCVGLCCHLCCVGCPASVVASLAASHGMKADQAMLRLCEGYSGCIVASYLVLETLHRFA